MSNKTSKYKKKILKLYEIKSTIFSLVILFVYVINLNFALLFLPIWYYHRFETTHTHTQCVRHIYTLTFAISQI